jgi:hypothetical protein
MVVYSGRITGAYNGNGFTSALVDDADRARRTAQSAMGRDVMFRRWVLVGKQVEVGGRTSR